MPAVDERLRADLERLAEPADPSGVFERLANRGQRRARARRLRARALAIAVAGVTATWIAIQATSPGHDRTAGQITDSFGSNGFVATCSDPYGTHLCRIGRSAIAAGITEQDLTLLTSTELETVSMPAVSPSGTTVVFDRTDPAEGTTSLWTVGIDGHDLRRLSSPESGLTNASWGPDGSIVAVASAGTPDGGPAALAILDPVQAPDPVVRTIELPGLSFPSSPRFSPDGRLILFSAGTDAQETGADVYTVRKDGSELTRRTRTPSPEWTPAWSPDGDRIAFGVGSPDGATIAVCPLECSRPRPLLDPSGKPIAGGLPAWSPDGRWIAYRVAASDRVATDVVAVDGSMTGLLAASVGEVAWIPEVGANERPGQVGMDIGLGFNLCHVQADRGLDLIGYPKPATVWTGFRVIPGRGCAGGSDGEGYLAVDVLGGRDADFSVGPLTCDPRCVVIATPDLDGDGDREIVLGSFVFVPTAPGRAWVYDVGVSEAGSGIFRIERSDGHPLVVTWGAGGAGSWEAGTACPEPGTVEVWHATSPDAGSTWRVRTATFLLQERGGRLVAALTSRSKGSELPDVTRLCGEDAPIGG